jgi:UbiD family decarboxylase
VYVVDKDIDIYNPLEVEWAMATRFQGDRDLVVYDRAPGSSLDPSAQAGTHVTTRLGFDLTASLQTGGKSFHKAAFPVVDLKRFIK